MYSAKVTHDNYTPGASSWHEFPVIWILFIYCLIWSHVYGNTYLFSVITKAVLNVCKCILSLINDVRFTVMRDTHNEWMRVSVDLLILLRMITQLPLITQATNHKCICISVHIYAFMLGLYLSAMYFILGGNYTIKNKREYSAQHIFT